jgi:GT2 family glycosyltransferase
MEEPLNTSNPAISVVIATRDRPTELRRCLESLASVQYADWEVLLIDQSDDARSEQVARAFSHLVPRLGYVRSPEKGLSRARNIGMHEARGSVVAFLDDDCTVGADWLKQVASVFDRYPETPLVFGRVDGPAYDRRTYFLPTNEIRTERTLLGRLAFLRTSGMGASMYLRTAVLEQVGPFDNKMGAGAEFRSAEDRDYCYRALARGLRVVETPEIVVHHHGVRGYEDGAASQQVRSAAYAFGVLHAKLLRCGQVVSLAFIAVEIGRNLARINLKNLLLRRRPTGLAWMVTYISGFAAGFRPKLDRRQCLWSASPVPISATVAWMS